MKAKEDMDNARNLHQFVNELRELIKQTQKFILEREPENKAYGEFAKIAAESMNKLFTELDTFSKHAVNEKQSLETITKILAETNAIKVISAHRTVADSSKTEASTGVDLTTGLEIGKEVMDKIADWLPPGPWQSGVKDIGHLLAIAAKLTSTTGGEIKRIEQKVASLQQSINGTAFPTGQIPDKFSKSKPPLRGEIQELEDKIEHFFEVVTGVPVPRNNDGDIAEVPGRAPYPTLPGSILWMAWELEHKLEHVYTQLVGGDFPKNMEGWVTSAIPLAPERSLAGEVNRLCKKVSSLARLLGKTLYDTEWDVDPRSQSGLHTVPRTARGPNETPPISIKDELHGLEDMLNEVLRILRILLRRKPPVPPEWAPPPPPLPPGDQGDPEIPECPRLPSDLKRIYVYEEGVFNAANATTEKRILVRTNAFDLAGWIDLAEMKDGDSASVEFYVLLPGNIRRLYKSRSFNDIADAALYRLSDIVGPGWIVGNAVDVVIRQTKSATGYAPPLNITYQFVVESQ